MNDNYFAEIAGTYLEQTGKLHIAPNEYVLMTRWKDAGIPLFIVIRVIEDIGKRAARKGVKIRGLNYFAEEIEAQHEEYLEGRVGVN